MNLHELTALELGKLLRSRDVSVLEATQAALARIEMQQPKNGAFITVTAEQALQDARDVQTRIDNGDHLSPLAGVPMAIKDNICTQGIRTTCASRMLENYVPPYDSTAVKYLKRAGAVLLGKLNMDEFAMGSTSETSFFGMTRNPWDPTRTPGGSSGGSSAAVAAGECWYSLGTDTGGSVRQPAAYCGITGIKPTYGAVSRSGLIAYASSLDQIGPMARTAADCAAVLDLICGSDTADSTSHPVPFGPLLSALDGDIRGLRIGLPVNCLGDGLESDIRSAVLAAAEVLRERGAVVTEFELPIMDYAASAYHIIAAAEASSNLARFDGVKYGHRTNAENLEQLYRMSRSEGFGHEVKRRILFGTLALSHQDGSIFRQAIHARSRLKNALAAAFERFDVLLTPVTPSTAPTLGTSLSDPLKLSLADLYTVPANLAGLPALSMPCGFDSQGLPIGVQLMGKAWSEPILLNAAHAFQQETSYHKILPPGGEPL